MSGLDPTARLVRMTAVCTGIGLKDTGADYSADRSRGLGLDTPLYGAGFADSLCASFRQLETTRPHPQINSSSASACPFRKRDQSIDEIVDLVRVSVFLPAAPVVAN